MSEVIPFNKEEVLRNKFASSWLTVKQAPHYAGAIAPEPYTTQWEHAYICLLVNLRRMRGLQRRKRKLSKKQLGELAHLEHHMDQL